MKFRILAGTAAAALVLASAAAGIASASDRAAADARAAATESDRAVHAIAVHDAGAAIAAAERAAALCPRDAGVRLILGQSYLIAGRFTSARAAYGDALLLAPDNGKAALNLVLTRIATGDWADARAVLIEHSATIAPADAGLALALAGDPAGGVERLRTAARAPGATAVVRQNLALALALAGDWPQARAAAAMDLSPADVDKAMERWAAFAHPRGAADQVASLLGVTPVADAGEPARLALVEPQAVVALAAPAPAAPMPTTEFIAQRVESRPAPSFTAAPAIVFGPRAEVVQPLPRSAANHPGGDPDRGLATVAPRRTSTPARPAASATGNWYVQLGAFRTADKAREAWQHATRRNGALAGRMPSAAAFRVNGAQVYRLSVGGFDRAAAVAICGRTRAGGGDCFVRAGAGDRIASWASPAHVATRVAAR